MEYTKKYLVVTVFVLGVLLSCANNSKDALYDKSEVATEAYEQRAPFESDERAVIASEAKDILSEKAGVPNFIATAAALNVNDDDSHKFIRTAQLKFKVKNVVEATHLIENVVIRNRGFILNSSISNNRSYKESINISKDSAIVFHYNSLIGRLQLKVPCQMLDTTLRQIAPLAQKVDYRIVNAEDVTTRLMIEQLAQIRLSKKQKRLSNTINTRSGKLNEAIDAEDTLDRTLEEEDRKKISEFSINEQIAYSVISIDLYQDETKSVERIFKERSMKDYDAGLGYELLNALETGWGILSTIFVLLLTIWPIWIILFVAAFLYIRIRRRKNKE